MSISIGEMRLRVLRRGRAGLFICDVPAVTPGPAPLCFARVHGCFECLSASRSDETVCLGAWTPPPPPPPTVIFISVIEELVLLWGGEGYLNRRWTPCSRSWPLAEPIFARLDGVANVLTCLSDGVPTWKRWWPGSTGP